MPGTNATAPPLPTTSPPGKTDINAAVNAIQTLAAKRHDGEWRIASLQNTPAQFHGRPELVEQLTEELRRLA